jgi:uncharacterized membrane protein YfcA
MNIELTVVGLIVGILVGMTGVGGASLMTPILLHFGIQPTIAVGTDLAYNSVTKIVGAIQHLRLKTVKQRAVFLLAFGSIPGCAAAIVLFQWIEVLAVDSDWILKRLIGAVLVIVSILSIWREIGAQADLLAVRRHSESGKGYGATVIAIGLIGGFIVGLTSVGSGSLFAVVLIHFFTLSGKELVGTDIVHASFLTTAASIFHLFYGNVDYGIVFNLVLGSIPGVLAGSRLSAVIPAKFLRLLILFLILISGVLIF